MQVKVTESSCGLSDDVEEKRYARFEGSTNYSWWDRKGQLNVWWTDVRMDGRKTGRLCHTMPAGATKILQICC